MTPKLSPEDSARVREIVRELGVLELGSGSVVGRTLRAIRELLGAESVLVLAPVERLSGWDVERFEHDGFVPDVQFKRRFLRFLDTAPHRYAWYDAARPEPEQRNRVIDAVGIIPAGEYEASRIYAEVMQPSRLHHHRQPRALLCDGASLLGWFGAFHPEPFDRRQNRILAAIAPAMRGRLRIERQLQSFGRAQAMLDQVLEQLGAPAYFVDARGRLLEANRSGRALLATQHRAIMGALRDAIAGRAHDPAFELTPIADPGAPSCWLAIARAGSASSRMASAIARATARWSLTPRQRAVLEQVVRGTSTSTIAAGLGISVRAVELHLTALFHRVGVENRAALVATVLAID